MDFGKATQDRSNLGLPVFAGQTAVRCSMVEQPLTSIAVPAGSPRRVRGGKAAFLLGSPHDSGVFRPIIGQLICPRPARVAMFARHPAAAISFKRCRCCCSRTSVGHLPQRGLDVAISGQPRQPIAPPPEVTICSQCEQGRRRAKRAVSECPLGLALDGASLVQHAGFRWAVHWLAQPALLPLKGL